MAAARSCTSNEAGIILRRKLRSARSRVFQAVFVVALGAPPSGVMEQAQAQDSLAQPPAPETTPAAPDAVFDAPGMPGVRMMAPIQDTPPMPVAKPARNSASASSVIDHAVLQQAFAATGRDWNRARLLAVQSGNPVAKLIIEWRYALDETSGANFEAINAFLNEHPNWPRHDALTIR